MILTFIDKDTHRILTSELNKFVKKVYCNNKYVACIDAIHVDFEMENFITVKVGWGMSDGNPWYNGKIDFDNNITLEGFMARFEQLIIHVDEGE